MFFDGTDHVIGAGDSVSAYADYKPIADAHSIDAVKLLLSSSVDLNGDTLAGTMTIDLEVAPGETIATPSGCKIRAALYESNLLACCEPHTGYMNWNYIGREMLAETTLIASLSGETQQVVLNFAIDPAWNLSNVHAIAWVQRDSNKAILQAAQAQPQYEVALDDLDRPVAKTLANAEFDSELTYTGTDTDDVTLTLDESALPGGWDAEIVWNSTTYPSTVTIPAMTQSQLENVTVRVIASGSPGLGTVILRAAPDANTSLEQTSTYHTFYKTPAIYFVDDDNAATFEGIYEDAILGGGYFSVTRNVTAEGNPGVLDMSDYDAVVWNTGALASQTIGPTLQTEIKNYLDAGGTLFLSSQGYLNHQGVGPTFTTQYLRVSAFTSNTGAPSVTGVAADPIGDGLSFALTQPFTDSADAVTPNTGGVAWLKSGLNNVGVRYDSGVFRTVFMSAAFEGVPSPNDDLLMGRILDWLLQPLGVDAPVVAASAERLSLLQNAPNPFQSTTSVRFALPSSGPVDLTIYDVAGRRVRDLVDAPMDKGPHAVSWDGRDSQGRRVASGVYLVRLTAGGETVSREMVRIE